MTVAVAEFITDDHGNPSQSRFVACMHKWYERYPNESYGGTFVKWISQFNTLSYTKFKPYNSFGNGSAMRISPVADIGWSMGSCMSNVQFVTEVSHNHP